MRLPSPDDAMSLTIFDVAFYASRMMELWQFQRRRFIVTVVSVLATIVCIVSIALAVPRIFRELFLPSLARLTTRVRQCLHDPAWILLDESEPDGHDRCLRTPGMCGQPWFLTALTREIASC